MRKTIRIQTSKYAITYMKLRANHDISQENQVN